MSNCDAAIVRSRRIATDREDDMHSWTHGFRIDSEYCGPRAGFPARAGDGLRARKDCTPCNGKSDKGADPMPARLPYKNIEELPEASRPALERIIQTRGKLLNVFRMT